MEWTLRDMDNEQAIEESEFREGETEVNDKEATRERPKRNERAAVGKKVSREQMMIITRAKGV